MNAQRALPTLLVLSIVLVGCVSQEVALDQTPPAVQAAIRKSVGQNKLDSLVKETEDGKVVYEAEFKDQGVENSVKVSETGEVVELEQKIAISALPKAVSDAATKLYPDGKITKAEKVVEKRATFFELAVETGGKDLEIKIDEKGTVLSQDDED